MSTMTIKLQVETGEIIEVLDHQNKRIEPQSYETLSYEEKIVKTVPISLYVSKKNPTCITYIHAGRYYRV